MSKPNRIFLVRHAQSEGNVDRSIHATIPDWQIPLSPLGTGQAALTGLRLGGMLHRERVGVYLSPYRRTVQTWQHIRENMGIYSPTVEFVKHDPRLREQEWGNLRAYDPRGWKEIEKERDAYGAFFYRMTSGESGADVYDRCSGFLDTLYRDFEKPDFPENVLIVTHGFAMRVLLMRWLHWSVDEFHGLRNPKNAEIVEMQLGKDGKYKLITSLEMPDDSAKVKA